MVWFLGSPCKTAPSQLEACQTWFCFCYWKCINSTQFSCCSRCHKARRLTCFYTLTAYQNFDATGSDRCWQGFFLTGEPLATPISHRSDSSYAARTQLVILSGTWKLLNRLTKCPPRFECGTSSGTSEPCPALLFPRAQPVRR